ASAALAGHGQSTLAVDHDLHPAIGLQTLFQGRVNGALAIGDGLTRASPFCKNVAAINASADQVAAHSFGATQRKLVVIRDGPDTVCVANYQNPVELHRLAGNHTRSQIQLPAALGGERGAVKAKQHITEESDLLDFLRSGLIQLRVERRALRAAPLGASHLSGRIKGNPVLAYELAIARSQGEADMVFPPTRIRFVDRMAQQLPHA